MSTFENAWRRADQLVDNTSQAISETAQSVERSAVTKLKWIADWANDFFSKIWSWIKSVWNTISDTHRWAVETTVSAMEWLAKAKDATINWANEAIASVSQRIDSFNQAISDWIAIVKLEWWKYIVEIKDDTWKAVKYAMERTTATWREVLANVNWKWQYVKDVGWDYADKATAAATVAYNNTLKPVWDVVVATGKAVGRAYEEWKRQYNQELDKTRMASRWTKPPEGSIQDARRLDNNLSTSKEYTIKSWDTLSKIALTEVGWNRSIAWEYLKKVADANPWINPDKIAVWQKINLPKVA